MKVFFSRGMDGLNPNEIEALDATFSKALASLGMSLSNPYKPKDARRMCISGISEIVEEDLNLLTQSDIVVSDMSLEKRSYIGAVIEMAKAYDLGKQTYVWVGNSENEKRIWLKYHATAICKDLENLIELLEITFTSEGQQRNRRELIAYYRNIAAGYDVNKRVGRFLHATEDESLFKTYQQEWMLLRDWVQELCVGGTVIDLGSGSGQWVPTWSKYASRVICIDASPEMLDISKEKNISHSVKHIRGDLLDLVWLKQLLSELGEINVVVLGFVLGNLTLEQEARFLALLREAVMPGTVLILLENQNSVFSNPNFFSRSEIQQRFSLSGDQVFRVYKRNFLAQDIRRILDGWGKTIGFFNTNNYFIAGIAHAS